MTDPTPQHYALLDAGHEQKLEQIGPFRVVRQAAQAHWPPTLPAGEWRRVDAVHHRSTSGGGHWQAQTPLPESWPVIHGGLRFKIKLTDFGHIGLFPEQTDQWPWIQARVQQAGARVLNLFGYTGGSSLAAAAAGAEVTHVDASRGAVSWARENCALNGLEDKPIRWIVEDVKKYLARELKRNSHYQGIILDPPSFGRGAKGEVWKIERDLIPLLRTIRKMARPLHFILLSCHTPGFGPGCLRNILGLVFGLPHQEIEAGEMMVPRHNAEWGLPSGTFARWPGRKEEIHS